ncbi:hypothetical protein JKF63_04690 [Porcisia hertigi]|uniref:Uncharacterized protein n=1 Tax=Porcisia hertigi TaxID=2761500 RepID=A0A836HN88_9TRYP|nr:hypothetical protein JKF63_04690 [Porcisia hertigi]
MSKALPPIQEHRPVSVDQNRFYTGSSYRGAKHDEYQRLYSSSPRMRLETADSHLSGRTVVAQLPQVEFSLGPTQERVIPPYNDLEDPHLELYWERKEMLIQERAAQRRRLRRQQEMEKRHKEEARQRFLQRRQQELEEIASRKGELTRRREEEERQASLRSGSKKRHLPPAKPLSERPRDGTAGGRSRQHAAAAGRRCSGEVSGSHPEEAEGRAAGDLPADHEYVTSSSSAATSRSASSHGNTSSIHKNSPHNEKPDAEKKSAAEPTRPATADSEDKTHPAEKKENVANAEEKAVPPPLISSRTSSSSSSYSQSSKPDRAAEEAAQKHVQADADVKEGGDPEVSSTDHPIAPEPKSSHHQPSSASSSVSSKSSAAAAYFSPGKEDGEAEVEAHEEEDASHSLGSAKLEPKEAYDEDEFERSSASRDSDAGAVAAPTAPMPEYAEVEGAEVPVASEVNEAHAGNANQPATAPANDAEENYSDDDFSGEDAAEPPQVTDVDNTKSNVIDNAYDDSSFEDELSHKKSSVASSVAPLPVEEARKGDVSKAVEEDYSEDEFDEEPAQTKAADADRNLAASAMSSSSVTSTPAAQSVPPSPSSNSEVAPAPASAASPADDDEYDDDFEGDM